MQTKIGKYPGGARKLDLAVVAVATMVGFLAVPGAANASEKQVPQIAIVDELTLKMATRPATRVDAKNEAKLHIKVGKHLDKLARAGKLADTAQVRVATVPDPNIANSRVHLIWDEGKVPHQVFTAKVAGKHAGFGSVFLDTATGQSILPASGGITAPVGSGYDAGSNSRNMYKFAQGCIDQNWESGGVDDHSLRSCWEKWAERGTDHWIYNRWGTFTRANYPWLPTTREFTIRSRPWAGTTDVSVLNSAAPIASAGACNQISEVDFGHPRAGITGKVKIPLHRCPGTRSVGSPARKEIAVQFLGQTRDIVRYLDTAGDYTAKNQTVVPTWADYSWVAVASELGIPPVSTLDEFVRKDSGW